MALFAALAAGLLAAAFNLSVSENVVDRAVLSEGHTHGDDPGAAHVTSVGEPFTRGEQRGGMVAGEVLLGAGVGLILAGLALVLGPRALPGRHRALWLALVGAGTWALLVLPAIKYTPLPPGVDAGMPIGQRQAAYLALVGCGLLGALLAGRVLVRWPASLDRRLRWPAALAGLALPAVLAIVLLPAQRATGELDDGLMTSFRAAAIGSQVVFWLAFALVGAWLLRPRDEPARPDGSRRVERADVG
ncbi:MAG: CbtA family protein [Thermoleophilia bacterium]